MLFGPVVEDLAMTGGGSRNDMWSKMRERRLAASFGGENVSVRRADCTEASFGAALLAAATFT